MPASETVLPWVREVTLENITAVRDRVNIALADSSMTKLVVDLHGLKFLDSLGLGVLIYAYNGCSERNAQFALRNVASEIRALLAHTNLEQHFNLE